MDQLPKIEVNTGLPYSKPAILNNCFAIELFTLLGLALLIIICVSTSSLAISHFPTATPGPLAAILTETPTATAVITSTPVVVDIPTSSNVQQTQNSYKLFLEFTTIFLVIVFNHLAGSIIYILRPNNPKPFKLVERLMSRWYQSVSIILIVLLIAIEHSNGLAALGIFTGQDNLLSNRRASFIGVSGLIVVLGAISICIIVIRIIKREPIQGKTIVNINPLTVEVQAYRDFWERFAYLTQLTITVVSEDLVYRGYLILFLWHETHIFIPWVILSVLFNVMGHLYQGRQIRLILIHILLAGLFAGLTIATQNIFAPIAAHLLVDFFSVFSMWSGSRKPESQNLKVVASNKKILGYSTFIGVNLIAMVYIFMQLFVYPIL